MTHPSHPDQLMARALGACWHPPTSDRWACAVEIPADSPHDHDSCCSGADCVACGGLHAECRTSAAGPPTKQQPLADWERELLRDCAACGCLMLSHGLGDGESGCRTDDCDCDTFQPPERGDCGCDGDPIECSHEAAQGELLGIASEIETLGHRFGIAAAGDSARNDLVSFEVNESISNTLRGFADRIRMALS